MSSSISFELTQAIIDAIETVLSKVFQTPQQAPNFDLEGFVKQVQELVPQAPVEVIVAYLQLYLTPMGENEDDYFMGEDFGEGFGDAGFSYDMPFTGQDDDEEEAPDLVPQGGM